MKLLNKILASSLIIASMGISSYASSTNTMDSLELYNVDLEKTILEEMVASIVHEQTIFDMYNDYILKTGDTDIKVDDLGSGTTFYDWFNIIESVDNNFLSAYNHNGMIDIEYNDGIAIPAGEHGNFSINIKNTFKYAKSYAYKRYTKELKNRNIKFIIDPTTGMSNIRYKLPLKTIKFIYKYQEIENEGLLIVNENDLLNDTIVKNKLIAKSIASSDLYTPDGEGGFIMYNATLSPYNLDYKGIVKTFDGVVVEGNKDNAILQANLNEKLPRIKGSIGYVVMDIKDSTNTNYIKSAIIEYVFDGTEWKKRYSSVNRESYVTQKVKDYYKTDLIIVGNQNISIENLNMFESTFVGGLYNTSKINVENPVTLEDPTDPFGNQEKTVSFDSVSSGQYNFSNIYARSYVTSNVNLDAIGGSIEELNLIAEDHEDGFTFKADVSACRTWAGFAYDASSDKCKKTVNTCNYYGRLTTSNVSGQKCRYNGAGTDSLCKNTPNGFKFETEASSTHCSNKISKNNAKWYCNDNNIGNEDDCNWLSPISGNTYHIDRHNGDWWLILMKDNANANYGLCHYYEQQGETMYKIDTFGSGKGCYWWPSSGVEIENPNCSGDDIRVGGACRDLNSGSIDDAKCGNGSNVAEDKFEDLIGTYFFQNESDKDKYVFGPLKETPKSTIVTETGTGNQYEVCDSIVYSQKAYKKFYVYPSFDIKINNIDLQGGHEIITEGSKYKYREILISECDWVGNNCKAIFKKEDLNNGMNNELNVDFTYGEIFRSDKKMGFNTSSKYFEIRKGDFTRTQLLPLTNFNAIDSGLNKITNSSNNRTVKVNALQFEISNGKGVRLNLSSGEVTK